MKPVDRYDQWLDSAYIDDETKSAMKEMTETEINESFYKDIEFGTAGLRSIVGPGTNRFNKYTIGLTTQAIADLLKENSSYKNGVAIAYDVRRDSEEIAKITASIFGANDIPVYIYDSVQATPILSYTVIHLEACAGVIITASHNPKEYNGYKLYGEKGSQILDDVSEKIESHRKTLDLSDIKWGDFQKQLNDGTIKYVDESVLDSYLEKVKDKSLRQYVDKDIKIVYSPLNGTGYEPIKTLFQDLGYTYVSIPEEEKYPDSEFTYIEDLNPEHLESYKNSLKVARREDSDIIILTDPDADRVGVMAKDLEDDYYKFTGNQIGVLMADYVLNGLTDLNKLPENGAMVKSVVSSDMIDVVGESFDIATFSTLTGFKNICHMANMWEETGEYTFIMGYEESIGYVYGDFVRDKDGIISTMIVGEMAAYYKSQGSSLYKRLLDLYKNQGYYGEYQESIRYEGKSGAKTIDKLMDGLRADPIKALGGVEVKEVVDHLKCEDRFLRSNLLIYYLKDGTKICVRPSGTEPLIKIYVYGIDKSLETAYEKAENYGEVFIESLKSAVE